jgi:hypothetical protein
MEDQVRQSQRRMIPFFQMCFSIGLWLRLERLARMIEPLLHQISLSKHHRPGLRLDCLFRT